MAYVSEIDITKFNSNWIFSRQNLQYFKCMCPEMLNMDFNGFLALTSSYTNPKEAFFKTD